MLGGEQLQRDEAHELPVVRANATSRGDRLAAFLDCRETVWLHHAAAHDREQQRRHKADEEHKAPTVTTDVAVDPGAEECAQCAAGHHEAGDLGTVRFAQGLGEQRNADHQFGSGAEAGDEAIDGEVPDAMRQALQSGEHAVEQDAGSQCPHAADIVGVDTEYESADGPAQQSHHAEDAAVTAELREGGIAAQQFGECGAQHQRVQAEVRCIQRPA